MTVALLDTDILSELLKQKNATVVQKASAYLAPRWPAALFSSTQFSKEG